MARNIIAIVDDLFFASKIRGTAEQLGLTITFPRTIEIAIGAAKEHQLSLIVCDLNSQRIDPIELAKRLGTEEGRPSIALLGFFSHVQTDLQKAAQEAGFDRVIPRSLFAKSLPQILSETE